MSSGKIIIVCSGNPLHSLNLGNERIGFVHCTELSKKEKRCHSNQNTKEESFMERSIIILVITSAIREIGRSIQLMQPCILAGSMPDKKDYSAVHQFRHDDQDWKRSVVMGYKVPNRMKVPRGIHRDSHGRPPKQKLTPSRFSKRNGSR